MNCLDKLTGFIGNSPDMKTSIPLGLVALVCFALVQNAHAVTPPPDGAYPGGNTAEGNHALLNLTTGIWNTAVGDDTLAHDQTGTANTATGFEALFFNQTGSENTACGSLSLFSNHNGNYNTATGWRALYNNVGSDGNTANGAFALSNNKSDDNTASGYGALYSNTTGHDNVASGFQALNNNTTGSGNIALGYKAGIRLTTGGSNIDVGSEGVAGEANTIRVGDEQTATFVAGISGATVTGTAVVVNGSGRLGVAPSSARFKEAIKSMNNASEAVYSLKPVTFRYKKEIDPKRTAQFGLVAEEVEKVNSDLVVHDNEGKVFTVRYEAVNAMLLNEFLKEHRIVQEQKAIVAQLKQDFQAKLVEQQKQIEALTTGLQKVSARLETSKPAPQTMANNQ